MQKKAFQSISSYSNPLYSYSNRQKKYKIRFSNHLSEGFLCLDANEVGVSPNTFLNALVK